MHQLLYELNYSVTGYSIGAIQAPNYIRTCLRTRSLPHEFLRSLQNFRFWRAVLHFVL
jgi:hypothetical protein